MDGGTEGERRRGDAAREAAGTKEGPPGAGSCRARVRVRVTVRVTVRLPNPNPNPNQEGLETPPLGSFGKAYAER